MAEEVTVGTLGIDVEANVAEFEQESGIRLKESSERIGREAGRSMGRAISEEAGAAGADLDRQLERNVGDVGQRAGRRIGGNIGAAAKDGIAQAVGEALDDLEDAFARRQREARESLAVRSIDTREFKRLGEEAAEEFNAGLEQVASQLASRGVLSPQLLAELDQFEKVGFTAGESVIDGLEDAYRARRADAKEQLARNLIDTDEFNRLGRDAAESFNASLAKYLDELPEGAVSPRTSAALADRFKVIGSESGRHMSRGIETELDRMATFLGRGGTSLRNVFRVGTREAARMRRETQGAAFSAGRLAGVMGTLLGILLAISGIRALFRFANEAKQLAIDTDRANDRLRALQDSVEGKRQAWRDFKIAVGEALLELRGTERAADVVGAILLGVKTIIEDNTAVWQMFGRTANTLMEGMLRFSAVLMSAVIGPTALMIDAVSRLHLGLARLVEGLARASRALGRGGLADALEERVASMREEAQATLDLAQDLFGAVDAMRQVAIGGFGALPQITAPGATSKRLAAEAKRAADERLRIERQLADQLARLTLDATDQQLRALDRLEAEYKAAGGRIAGEFAANMARLRQAALHDRDLAEMTARLAELAAAPAAPDTVRGLRELALHAESFRDAMAGSIPHTERLDQLIAQTTKQTRSIEADALVSGLQESLERRRIELRELLARDLIDERAFAEQGDKAGRAFNTALLGRIAELRDAGLTELADALVGMLEGAPNEEQIRQQRLRDLRDQARLLEENARAATQVAEALGLIGSEAARSIQSVAQLAGAITRIAGSLEGGFNVKTFDFSAVGLAIGAAATLISSFGESEEEKARRRVMEENTRALERLTRGLTDLSALSGERGTTIAGIAAAAEAAAAVRVRTSLNPFETIDDRRNRKARQAFNAELERLGLTMEDAERIARQFNITLDGSQASFIALSEAMKKFELSMLFASPEGRIEMMEREERLLDIEDPVELLERRRQVLLDEMKLSDEDRAALEGLDLSTAAGQAAFQAFVLELFRRIKTGELTEEEVGDLTPSRVLALIDDVAKLTKQAQEETRGAEGFQISRTITEVTANRMIGTLSTIAHWTEFSARQLGAIARALGAQPTGGSGGPGIRIPERPTRLPMPGLPASGAAGSSTTTLHFGDIHVSAEFDGPLDPTTAEDSGRSLGRGIVSEIDRHLAHRSTDSAIARGRRP